MANLPQSLSMNAPFGGGGGGPTTSNLNAAAAAAAAAGGAGANKDRKMASAEHLVLDLSNPELRENALLELSKCVYSLFYYVIVDSIVEFGYMRVVMSRKIDLLFRIC
ncbi:hypothetical protein QYF36_011476 [Acer negundo]|nr:hypothetical protein QYF36_011476 [Acer negundo]